MKSFVLGLTTLLLAGCAMPVTTVTSGTTRPALVVRGAPAGSTLYLDNLEVGPATNYDGVQNKLLIEEGVHTINVRQAGQTVFVEKFYIAKGETHAVSVGGGQP